MSETWYLVWPDRIEEIPWDEYRERHSEDAGQFIDSRGPFPTLEDAEDWRWRDMLPGYWEHGMTVYANHCLGCGRWAKVLAFDDEGGGWAWRVTECKTCGILDSRAVES